MKRQSTVTCVSSCQSDWLALNRSIQTHLRAIAKTAIGRIASRQRDRIALPTQRGSLGNQIGLPTSATWAEGWRGWETGWTERNGCHQKPLEFPSEIDESGRPASRPRHNTQNRASGWLVVQTEPRVWVDAFRRFAVPLQSNRRDAIILPQWLSGRLSSAGTTSKSKSDPHSNGRRIRNVHCRGTSRNHW